MPFPLGRFTLVGVGRDGVRHNKFWECLDACNGRYQVRWGAIGQEGRTQMVDAADAQRRIDDKRGKGYEHDPRSPTTVPNRMAADLERNLPAAPSPVRRARL